MCRMSNTAVHPQARADVKNFPASLMHGAENDGRYRPRQPLWRDRWMAFLMILRISTPVALDHFVFSRAWNLFFNSVLVGKLNPQKSLGPLGYSRYRGDRRRWDDRSPDSPRQESCDSPGNLILKRIEHLARIQKGATSKSAVIPPTLVRNRWMLLRC